MSSVTIIGGGIVGLCSAYYLRKAGHEVTIVDQGDLLTGCSYGNAGMIVPSHFVPLAAPGMIAKGIRWMFNSTSPFYVKPRWDTELFKWGYQFYKHATADHVASAVTALRDLGLYSKSCYQELRHELPFDFGWNERGLMMLYQTQQAEAEEQETVHLANRIGIEAHVLDQSQIQKLEPDVEVKARGAIYFPGDCHLTPQLFMKELLRYVRGMGVQIITQRAVNDFEVVQGEIRRAITDKGDLTADEWIIAAGSWSPSLSKKLNLRLPMQAGKGYSFTLPGVTKNIHIPSILVEARVAVTPMGSDLRFGGTMEIGGINSSINMNRVGGIVNAIPNYYPGLHVDLPRQESVWYGLRPCSPDGLPFIGRPQGLTNLVIATGHAMMGVSLAPGTGKIVTALLERRNSDISVEAFQPDRFS